MRKIILLGYMGSGKSTIGKLLSEEIKLPFLDLDAYIEQREGQSISKIFQAQGEIYFRKKEREYLSELLENNESWVLSLGGGTPCFGDTMKKIIESKAISIYLRANANTLSQRLIKEKNHRPLISHLKDEELPEFINKHLFERNPFYIQAHYMLDVNKKSAEQVVSEIMRQILNS